MSKRLVVKVGSSSLTGAAGAELDLQAVDALVDALAFVRSRGDEVLLVSSGAIATGLSPLKLKTRPRDLATQQAAALLPESRVVGAFHNVSAVDLLDPEKSKFDIDVLVLGDDRETTDLVQELVAQIPGARGVYGGRLRNAHQVEAFTANIISMNRRYKAHASLKITDI